MLAKSDSSKEYFIPVAPAEFLILSSFTPALQYKDLLQLSEEERSILEREKHRLFLHVDDIYKQRSSWHDFKEMVAKKRTSSLL